MGLLQLSLIPSFEPMHFFSLLESSACNGIILQSFGAGNVPCKGKYSLKEFIQTATKRNIPVLITSQFPANSTLYSDYESGVEAIKAGAIPTGNMTSAAACVKFRWVLHLVNEQIKSGFLLETLKLTMVKNMMTKVYVSEMDYK